MGREVQGGAHKERAAWTWQAASLKDHLWPFPGSCLESVPMTGERDKLKLQLLQALVPT